MNEQKILQRILKDKDVDALMKDLGFEHDSPDDRMEILGAIGSVVMDKVVLEVLKAMPRQRHADLEKLIGTGDDAALRKLVKPHIKDFDAFVAEVAKRELGGIIENLKAELSA